MIGPVILNGSDLETLEKQVLFLAMNQFAEDNDSLILDYRALRKGTFLQFSRVRIAEVVQMVIELAEADMIWLMGGRDSSITKSCIYEQQA